MAASVRQHTLRKKQNCGSDALKHCSAQTHVVRLPDEPLPGSTLEALVTTVASRSVALVDVVIRVTLDDVNVRKHGLLTFHQRGFSDFLQETPNRNIENAVAYPAEDSSITGSAVRSGVGNNCGDHVQFRRSMMVRGS
jgi:hypothetical protein